MSTAEQSQISFEDDAFYAEIQRDILLLMDDDDEEYHDALLWMANLERDYQDTKNPAGAGGSVVAGLENVRGVKEDSSIVRDGNQGFRMRNFNLDYQETEGSKNQYGKNWSLSGQTPSFLYPSEPHDSNLCTYIMPSWLRSYGSSRCKGTGVFIPPESKPKKTNTQKINPRQQKKMHKQLKNKNSS